MKTVLTIEVDKILKVGHQLTDIGLHSWALTKSQALTALEQLAALQISILGGDVCQYVDGIIQPNYDSWHCDQLPDESKDAFFKRSITKAKQYIELYQAKKPDKIFFVLVPDI